MNKNISEFLKLNWFDAAKGAIVAAISAVLTSLVTLLQDGHFPTGSELKTVGAVALTAGLSYLLKNFFSNSAGQPLKKEALPALDEHEAFHQ